MDEINIDDIIDGASRNVCRNMNSASEQLLDYINQVIEEN